MFKNESHALKEWIEHYIFHGVDHFYLLNDESDDNYYEILKPYIDKKIITLFDLKWDRYFNRQEDIYNHYILPRIKESKWILICDLDEFMWSPMNIDLKHVLNMSDHLATIQVVQTLYGSNNHITQPKSIIHSFTKRRDCQYGYGRTHNYKYFINSTYPFKKLRVHSAIPANEYDEKNRWLILYEPYYVLNHYSCQSREWFQKKCDRTDADHFKKLTMDDFPEFDLNEVEDTRLSDQNKDLIF